MNNSIKRSIYGTYLLMIILQFFFRTFEYSYLEFYFNTFLIITSISIMMKFYTGNDKSYYIPLGLSVFMGLIGVFLGITQAYDQLMGGLAVFLGIGIILIGVINIPLKKVYDHLFFPMRKKGTENNELIITFFIFFLYMLTLSRTTMTALNDVGSGTWLIFLVVIFLNILFFLFNWLLKRYSKEHNFNIIYSVLLGILGIVVYLTFNTTIESTLLVNLSIGFISLLLYVCLILIKDIFKIINE